MEYINISFYFMEALILYLIRNSKFLALNKIKIYNFVKILKNIISEVVVIIS